MTIDTNTISKGNQAMASVLLLYYHLLQDGGFANDQTVYLRDAQFNGFDYIDVRVVEEYQTDIDELFLREAAVIYLLCDLNDVIGEYETDFLSQPSTQTIIASLSNSTAPSTVSEINKILEFFHTTEDDFDHKGFNDTLSLIYSKYVVARFSLLVHQNE